jgi:hypothetical protein
MVGRRGLEPLTFCVSIARGTPMPCNPAFITLVPRRLLWRIYSPSQIRHKLSSALSRVSAGRWGPSGRY